VLAAAGVLYARLKNIPGWAAAPLLAAFLAEYPFYLVLGFPTLRDRFAGRNLPAYLFVSAMLPYLIVCMGPAEFQWLGFLRLAALALAMGLWYRVLPAVPAVDLALLALFPAVLLGGYLQTIYVPRSILRNELVFLGHFTQIELWITVLMVGRRVRETGFGFVPTPREWRIGGLHYLYFLAIGLPLGFALSAIRWRGSPAPAWSIVGTFVGLLWVVALSEEFLVWGVLREWIEEWKWSRTLALVICATIFGLVHLPFGGTSRFPNWRAAFLAAVLGLFVGRARNQAGGIRAGVVTHALAVATWRGFFSS
jgi:hypothetical protein